MYSLEEFEIYDKAKSKVLKYVLYKKRTEQEVRQKFSKELEETVLNDIIEELKENAYIDDYNYIDRSVNEYINLKNLSITEVKYKLYSKGIKSNLIEEYIYENKEELLQYEIKSACNIIYKKRNTMNNEELKLNLVKKGYKEESIKEAFNNLD
ncbi:MAG: hypothetical protein E7313_01025 [Clostridiales bacterium]|nr:hypothetical protein [Clostridiales bacterium]